MGRNHKTFREGIFWQVVAGTISLLLLVCVILNLQNPSTVPPQITSFLFGCLISIAVGYSVISPRSSPVLLPALKETKLRLQQYAAGIIISVLIALMFLSAELRAAPSSWILVPIMLLTPALIIRKTITNKRPRSSHKTYEDNRQ